MAVVYYRAGYSPDHYHGDLEWLARLTIERSTAIKCPNIQYHLAGTKKVSMRQSLFQFFNNLVLNCKQQYRNQNFFFRGERYVPSVTL